MSSFIVVKAEGFKDPTFCLCYSWQRFIYIASILFFFLLLQEYIFRMMDDRSILACRQYSGVVAVMSKGEIQLLPPVPPGWGADADRASSTFKQCSQTHCTSMNTDCISLLVNVRSCFHSAFPHTLSLLCPEWIALGRHLQDKVNFLGFLSWRLKWRKVLQYSSTANSPSSPSLF